MTQRPTTFRQQLPLRTVNSLARFEVAMCEPVIDKDTSVLAFRAKGEVPQPGQLHCLPWNSRSGAGGAEELDVANEDQEGWQPYT